MSKRDSPDDPEPPEEPKRAEIEQELVPRRPFVLYAAPRMSCEGPSEPEASVARSARREATRARNARAAAAAAFVVDVDAPNTVNFGIDHALEVQVVAVQQTERRNLPPREVFCAESVEPAPTVAYRAPESKDSEDSDSDDEEVFQLPPHGSEGLYLSRGDPPLWPLSPAYEPPYEPSEAYVPSEACAPQDSDEDFVQDEDGNSGVLGPDDA
jgi:hypothetical protein